MTEQEDLRQAVQVLMENRWVTRKDMPEEYLLIRRQEKILRQFFRDRCGWPLIVTAQFYKLEKIPHKPRAFMGLEAMQSAADYVLLACVMAFLEEYEAGGQFLLGDLAEALLSYYPEDALTPKLVWEDYKWRKALIRVIKFLAEAGILRIVDDESEAFLSVGFKDGVMEGEALYEVTSLARYFLRSFPKELMDYHSPQELIGEDFFTDSSAEMAFQRGRRHRIYREALLTPVYYRSEETEKDFDYLRRHGGKLETDLEEYFGLHMELYADALLAVSHEQNTWFRDSFPVRFRGIHDIMLHLSHYLRNLPEVPEQLTLEEWQAHVEKLTAAAGRGWTKEYREMSSKRLAEILLQELTDWSMAEIQQGVITLLPALYRCEGVYPHDYDGRMQEIKTSKKRSSVKAKQETAEDLDE